jgi:Cd2+/Zn2+-exporting ATPase
MPSSPELTRPTETDAQHCVARSVVDAFAENPALEAVTIDRKHHAIAVATLGRTDVPQLTERIRQTVQDAQRAGDGACSLVAGEGNCSTCERPLSPQELKRIVIQRAGCSTTISRVTCPTAPKFWRWRNIPWPKVVPREIELHDHEEHADEWKGQMVAAVLCGVFGLSAYAFRGSSISIAAYVLAYLAGSFYTVQEVWERLQKREIDVHFLMLAVAAGSASIGAWGEGAMLLFLFSFSGALEHYALGRTQREISSLFREAPKIATLVDETGNQRQVSVEKLAAGMRLVIKPGDQFPVDAEIVKGQTAADESNLTGEATPGEKGLGDQVLAGTINLWGAVEATVLRPAAESSLQKIIHLIREAQLHKAPAQQFTDKFSTWYTYAVLVLAMAMFFVWWQIFHLSPFVSTAGVHSAFYRTMTLLVVSSPCALVLSIPSAVLAAIAWSARHGILFRGGAAVEKLAGVNIVALDKTGTLTTGELRVETINSFPPGKEAEVAALAYSLEQLSTHPLARAIVRYGKQQKLGTLNLERFESLTGKGLRARHDGVECRLGRRDWLADGNCGEVLSNVPATDAGFSEIWLSKGELIGRIVLRDDIRPQAKDLLHELRRAGLRSVVLTGDRQAAAEHLRAQLQLEDVRAELKPEDKLAAIQKLGGEGRVAMIGDGVNDAPSLAAAHIGVAMGARGSDAALEQADVVLMHDRLENFLAAFQLSQRARRVIRQNLVISLGTVVVLVTFAMLGKIPLTLGVVGHEGSTVVVVMNSLRLLLGRQKTSDRSPQSGTA